MGGGFFYHDTRFISQFVRSALEGRDIVLHTEGKSILTSCYISDAINGILTILLKGVNGECYNLANSKNVLSIREIAELIQSKYPTIKIIMDLKHIKYYRADSFLIINTDKLNALGWKANIDFNTTIDRTIASYLEERNEK